MAAIFVFQREGEDLSHVTNGRHLCFSEGGGEPEQPGGVHLSDAADPPTADIQVKVLNFFQLCKKIKKNISASDIRIFHN